MKFLILIAVTGVVGFILGFLFSFLGLDGWIAGYFVAHIQALVAFLTAAHLWGRKL